MLGQGTNIISRASQPTFSRRQRPISIKAGMVFDGRFMLGRRLAEGGMSKIYLARDFESRKKVVLKIVEKEANEDCIYYKALKKESEILALLSEKNFPKFLGTNVNESSPTLQYRYIAMEHIPGRTLGEVIDAAREGEESFPLYKALEIAMQICGLEGLGALHEMGYVHRDIKPDNIVLNQRDGAVLLDLGLACAFGFQDKYTAGSLTFMSPEQLRILPIYSASDIYSVGVTLYEMITHGKRGFNSGLLDSMIDTEKPPEPVLELEDISERIVPEKRGKLEALVEDLYSILAGMINGMTLESPEDRFENLEEIIPLLEEAHKYAIELAPYENSLE